MSITVETVFPKYFSCGKLFCIAEDGRGQAVGVGSVDAAGVVVADYVAEHRALNLTPRESLAAHPVDQLLLQRSKEALHPRVVVAAARAAHALRGSQRRQLIAVGLAGELAAPVAVDDHSPVAEMPAHAPQRRHAQLGAHVVGHGEAHDLAVETVQHGGKVELAVGAGDLGDVRHQFCPGGVAAEVAGQQVLALLCRRVRTGQAVGMPGFLVDDAMALHGPVHSAAADRDAPMQQR